ncbi:hypothetical protein [Oceanirhabdus sp. W0125-5]|uniref:hypothetical protein n=1 Tax=Oceanirhabdus sp. W0125-5 TaxID=2999116 RepID=UPI0022F2C221|nr:hypothetical protein [Oceanirhabdus sp. W0125-5]WBW98371.1 hypothetical protein OW730_06275 [Oceanirhabdus sp. W0125-5]
MNKSLVDECIEVAIDYCTYSIDIVENYKKTNKLFEKSHKLFLKLKSSAGGIEKLYELLNHEHIYVRYTASIYLLNVDEKAALDCIERLRGINRHLDFDIKYLLKEWKAGNLTIY